jgi:predicted nucleic acid-binding protein
VILIDAGPLVALLHADDQHHARCVAALRAIRAPLGTVWPAVTEAMYLLAFSPEAQAALWDRLAADTPRLLGLDRADVPRLRELMWKFRDRPMDLADAALVRVAEREGIDTIFTIDRTDFEVYRLPHRKRFNILP